MVIRVFSSQDISGTRNWINSYLAIHSFCCIQGVQNLYDRMERMQRYGPEFIDVTWGAGGTSADLTTEIVATAQSVYGLETMMHLTCTNMPVKQIDDALEV